MQVKGSNPRRAPSPTRMLEIARTLVSEGIHVVTVDNEPSSLYDKDGIVNLTGKTTLAELGAVVEAADVVIAPDSGVLHLGNALNKPVVGLFGPVATSVRVKQQPNCTTLAGNGYVNCGPCNDAPPNQQCNVAAPPCLEKIPIELIVEAVKEKL